MTDHARYELQFILADGKHHDCPEVVARSQAEAEAFALATIGPTMEFAAPIVGVWFVDSEPVLLATPPGEEESEFAAAKRLNDWALRELAATANERDALRADIATSQKATNDIIASLRAALKRQAERHGEPLPLVYFRSILGDEGGGE